MKKMKIFLIFLLCGVSNVLGMKIEETLEKLDPTLLLHVKFLKELKEKHPEQLVKKRRELVELIKLMRTTADQKTRLQNLIARAKELDISEQEVLNARDVSKKLSQEVERLKEELEEKIKEAKSLKKELEKEKLEEEKTLKKEEKKFTQMEAYLRTFRDRPEEPPFDPDQLLPKLVTGWYGHFGGVRGYVQDYVDMLGKMLQKERELNDYYYSFYHAHNPGVALLFDTIAAVRKWLEVNVQKEELGFRLKTPVAQKNMDEFMGYWNAEFDKKRKSFWNDRNPELKNQILSANFVPFGNTEKRKGGVLHFFIEQKSINAPEIEKIFEGFNFDEKYIEQLKDLYKKYMIPERGSHMLQIFVPNDKVNTFVYPCLGQSAFYKREYYNAEKKRPESISEILTLYVNDPIDKIGRQIIDRLQSRIVLFPEFFDPATGIKLFRYDFVSDENKEKYKIEFNKIVNEMMENWIKNKRYEKLAADKKNFLLVRMLRWKHYKQWGEIYKELRDTLENVQKETKKYNKKLGKLQPGTEAYDQALEDLKKGIKESSQTLEKLQEAEGHLKGEGEKKD